MRLSQYTSHSLSLICTPSPPSLPPPLPSPPPPAVMTEVLAEALEAGEVTALDDGAFRCEVCKQSYSSKASVKTHLNTKKHNNNLLTHSPPKTNPGDVQRQSRAGYSDEGQQAKATDWNNGNSLAPRTTGGAGSPDEEVLAEALEAGEVTALDDGAFRCEVCKQSYSSKASVKTHLNTKKHNNNLLTYSPPKTNPGDVQRQSRAGYSDEGQQAKATDWNNGNSLAPRTTGGAGSPDEEVLAEALEAGKVTALDDGAFKCEVCKQSYSSKASVKTHLNTKKHSNNLKSFCEKATSAEGLAWSVPVWTRDGRPITPKDRGHCVPLGTESLPGLTAPLTLTPDDTKASTRVTKPTQIMQSDLEYPHDKQLPPGRVYVFNYIYFHHNTRQTVEDRMGAKEDSKNLKETFTKLGYEVRLHEDLTAEDTMKEVETIKKDRTLKATQACFFFFLSHGTNSKEFLAADGKRLNLDQLRNEFTNDRCPALAGKPTIFMTNYCRGNNEERMQTDGLVSVPRDIVTIYANTDGIAAYRLPGEGTCFVLSLCHVLKGLRERTDLRHVYLQLSTEMQRRQATSPTWEDICFKNFFLEMPSTYKKEKGKRKKEEKGKKEGDDDE
ncbi:uncharacterized protein LOC127001684 isoform X3 [Eriocheir sinensis]|uniref:uncharacterized protein LOC127001684 isoform X3 n=1 Tax=Eriocheir sinensis TaxID=95602 RepID=UPI0021CA610D|nr:uncharacterized protein LOC127001684 isoform X3 [Eriocheir sinensis]